MAERRLPVTIPDHELEDARACLALAVYASLAEERIDRDRAEQFLDRIAAGGAAELRALAAELDWPPGGRSCTHASRRRGS